MDEFSKRLSEASAALILLSKEFERKLIIPIFSA